MRIAGAVFRTLVTYGEVKRRERPPVMVRGSCEGGRGSSLVPTPRYDEDSHRALWTACAAARSGQCGWHLAATQVLCQVRGPCPVLPVRAQCQWQWPVRLRSTGGIPRPSPTPSPTGNTKRQRMPHGHAGLACNCVTWFYPGAQKGRFGLQLSSEADWRN